MKNRRKERMNELRKEKGAQKINMHEGMKQEEAELKKWMIKISFKKTTDEKERHKNVRKVDWTKVRIKSQ